MENILHLHQDETGSDPQMAEDELQALQKRMDKLSNQLDDVRDTLNKIAVQDEQIRQLQSETRALWAKFDRITNPDGSIEEIKKFQASCPRDHIKAMWWIVIPMGVAIMGIGVELIIGL